MAVQREPSSTPSASVETIVLRHLPAMKHLDAVAREFQCVERVTLARLERRGDLFLRHPQAGGVEVELIELSRVVAQGFVAASGDVGDDRAHRCFNVSRYFALGVEKRAEFFGKIGGAGVEANDHRMPCDDALRAVRRRVSVLFYYNNSNLPEPGAF